MYHCNDILQISFVKAEKAEHNLYYPKFIERDSAARDTYRKEIRGDKSYKDDIFVLDILREGMKDDDPRIQRIISE